MIYIFEGCDGTGKTTAATKLAKELGVEVIHFDASIAKNPDAFFIFYDLIIQSIERDIVVDRFFHGQFIYQNEKERVLSMNELKVLESSLIRIGYYLYVVEARPQTISKRLREREEKPINSRKLMRKYRRFFSKQSLLSPVYMIGE